MIMDERPRSVAEIEQIARVCYDTNRAYCLTLGDTSQPEWKDAAEWQRRSIYSGVRFHLDNPLANPIDSHDNWMREKLADGWTFGPVKDADKKEHPCMQEYRFLPEEQQRKDSLFIGVVRALTKRLAV